MIGFWTKIFAFAVAFIVAGAAIWYVTGTPLPGIGPQPVACTAEAMQCPDGTWVGRTGPHCEFICPTASSTTDGTSAGTGSSGGGFAEYRSGIKGTILAGPTCPVERNPPDPACADRPLQINVFVSRIAAPQQVITTVQSGTQGAFKISLPPGEYTVHAGNPGTPLPRCTDIVATVGPTGYTQVSIGCDTGIR